MDASIKNVAQWVKDAKRILFITGAGISAESGLPTYRGIGGLYEEKHTEHDIPIELALSGQMMASQPEITWEYLLQVESACRGAGFNRAHQIIADIERQKPDCWVLTQNIDGFHQQAGSQNVIEIHGSVGELFCTACGVQEKVADYSHLELPPACDACGGLVRPNVVLFGEMLPSDAVSELQRQLQQGFDLVFSIGTTSVFPYIAQPVFDAKMWGAKSIEINPGETEVSEYVDSKLAMGAVAALNAIWGDTGTAD
ncbi:MAG: NAD-dependent deacylase [Pseudomonadales bacterium]|nr:NAD-dependent deacylase [Pseudomonadales bacterium]